MTALDMIKLGIVPTHEAAEELAETLVDKWHDNLIPGELYDVLGLTPREYQAWATGGVSLLTIAHWQKTSHPPLDHNKPWFRLSGEPGGETVGYLGQVAKNNSQNDTKARRSAKLSPKRK